MKIVVSSAALLTIASSQNDHLKIICPFISSMVNDRHLDVPFGARPTEAELTQLTINAGLNTKETHAHVEGNFKKIPFDADGVKRMDIYHMEGAKNEHLTSTGINDCDTVYHADGAPTTVQCPVPNEAFFDAFWKVAALDGDSQSMSYADLAGGADYGLFADLDPSFPANEAGGTIEGAFGFLLDIAKDLPCGMSKASMRRINIERHMPTMIYRNGPRPFQFPSPNEAEHRMHCPTSVPFVCRDGWESSFAGMLSEPPEWGNQITEERCLQKALDAGHSGYYFDWNPHLGGWCRMVIDPGAQSQKMASSSSWVEWSTSHTCIRRSFAPALSDSCVGSGLCKTLQTRSQIKKEEDEDMTCRSGWETNWWGLLGDPPMVGNGITEADCKHAAFKQGFFGYYYDWNPHWGGWCRFVLDAERQGEKIQRSRSWTVWETSHTCVLNSQSTHLPCSAAHCYVGATLRVPYPSSRRLTASNESFMV